MWRKILQAARKAERKRAKTNSSKSGKRPTNNIKMSKSTAKLFFNVKNISRCTIRRILKKYGIVSRKAAKKFNLNKKQRMIRGRWCSRNLKTPLGFNLPSIFHQKWESFEIFWKQNYFKKSQIGKKTKTKLKVLSNQITFLVN